MGRQAVSDTMGRIANGEVLAFGGVELWLPTLDQLARTFRELCRMSCVTGGDDFDFERTYYLSEPLDP